MCLWERIVSSSSLFLRKAEHLDSRACVVPYTTARYAHVKITSSARTDG
jgi:hypothetical protein